MGLAPEQEELLATLVEAARKVPRFQQEFLLVSYETDQEIAARSFVMGAGLEGQLQVLADDVWQLDRAGLLGGQWNTDGEAKFTITADGYAYYEGLRGRTDDAGDAVEEEIRRHLDGERFKTQYPEAYKRLRNAERLLWQARPEDDLTTIGHSLRESLQQFATAMVEKHNPTEFDADPAKTKNRLRVVVDVHRERLGDRKANLLVALLDYTDAVNGVVQRLEHADQKAKDPVTWEDARAAVFQTAMLMFEFDRILNG